MTRLFRRFTRWLVRLLLRAGLLPTSTKADTDTMGDWKRLQAEKDDPRPGLVLPDPNAPHADLIRRVRLYAQNGAKALAPLLDGEHVPDDVAEPWAERSNRRGEFLTNEGQWAGVPRSTCWGGEWSGNLANTLLDVTSRRARDAGDQCASYICADMTADVDPQGVLEVVTNAYNSPWTVIDGEVYEYESEKRKRVVQ
jgi:hypothetical protein